MVLLSPPRLPPNPRSLRNPISPASAASSTGSSGGGIVKVTVNGTFEVVDVQIDPIAVDPRDVKMLQDLIVAASHDAMEKIKDGMKDKLGGLNIPGLNL